MGSACSAEYSERFGPDVDKAVAQLRRRRRQEQQAEAAKADQAPRSTKNRNRS